MSTSAKILEDNTKFIDARTAGKLVGYSSDYVTRLAREGKIHAVQTGRQWLVDPESLKFFTLTVQAQKRERAKQIREERRAELVAANFVEPISADVTEETVLKNPLQQIALAQTVAIAACLFITFHLVWFSLESRLNFSSLALGANVITEQLKASIFQPLKNYSTEVASVVFSQETEVQNEPPLESSQSDSTTRTFEGIVIIEDSPQAPTEIDSIRESFSDEVSVEFDGVDSGVLKPVFKNQSNESYRFLLTPVKNQGE